MGKISVNDKVEVISRFNPDLYGEIGVVIDMKTGTHGSEARVRFDTGYETWIDIEDLSIFLEL